VVAGTDVTMTVGVISAITLLSLTDEVLRVAGATGEVWRVAGVSGETLRPR
jgi:hypothetical protein